MAGFTVDIGSLSKAVSQLASISDSLRKLDQAPNSASGKAASALDNFVANTAIGAFGQEYHQALADLASAVDQDSQTLQTNLRNYHNADTGGH